MSRLVARLLLAMAGVVLVVACSAGATGEALVEPFSEVQASEFLFENDPGFPDRGIFRVTTTEPMICAIVWGETDALGWFNNSLNMAGTGIVEHDVFLPGAKAGGTYFFRVQGSTANGSLYTTELMTFTLPERDDAVADSDSFGGNVAVGATVVEVSSEFGSSWLAGNAIDADPTTEWASAGDGDDAFLTIDLGGVRQVSGVAYLTRSMADGSATVRSFSVVVDGVGYGPFPAGNPADPSVSDLAIRGQVFRFEVGESTGGNTGAVELAVYANNLAG